MVLTKHGNVTTRNYSGLDVVENVFAASFLMVEVAESFSGVLKHNFSLVQV